MKIINLCFGDMAGSGFCLSHAINKYTDHQSINLRSTSNYIEYPAIAEMHQYNLESCREMVNRSDVVIFHCVVRPFYQGLGLNPDKLKDKIKILYFHGSELRRTGKELLEQADRYLKKYSVAVSTPDMLLYEPEDADWNWLPVARSFSEISRRYSPCNQDFKALESFGVLEKKVILCHAPTSEEQKGSKTFYKVITKLIRDNPNLEYMTIRNVSWYSCLRRLATADIYFDQNPPFISSYGMAGVEASIFHIPIVTKITRQVIDLIKEETGLSSPFITFGSEQELMDRVYLLTQDAKLRKRMGDLAYRYCKAVHDEKAVAARLLTIIEDAA